jgi:Tfp pilus assembly protein PilO
MKPIDLTINSNELFSFLDKKREDRYFYRLIEITITVVVITLFLVFAVRPSVLTISALIGEIKTKEEVSTQMRKKINNVVIAQEVYAQIQEKYQLVESALPESPQYAQLTEQIVSAGAYSQSPVTNISFDINTKSANTLPLSFSQTSGFLNSINFLDKLNKNRRIFQINNLGFGQDAKADSQSGQESSVVTTSYSLNSFYLKNSLAPNDKK